MRHQRACLFKPLAFGALCGLTGCTAYVEQQDHAEQGAHETPLPTRGDLAAPASPLESLSVLGAVLETPFSPDQYFYRAWLPWTPTGAVVSVVVGLRSAHVEASLRVDEQAKAALADGRQSVSIEVLPGTRRTLVVETRETATGQMRAYTLDVAVRSPLVTRLESPTPCAGALIAGHDDALALSLAGTQLLVGGRFDGCGAPALAERGRAILFRRAEAGWKMESEVAGSAAGARLGSSVTFDGETPTEPCAPGGLIRIALKKPFSDGTVAVDLDPLSLLSRLAASVPAPRFHTVRYAGVLGSASKLRARLVPKPAAPRAAVLPEEREQLPRRRAYRPWAELLMRTFGLDV